MRLPPAEAAKTPRMRKLREWDIKEYFSPDPAHWWTIHFMNRLTAVTRGVRKYTVRGGRVLDIGCAQGNISLLLAERGFSVIAVDADIDCLRYARLRHVSGSCAFICVDAMQGLDSIRNEFDAIVLGEVIEHVPRPGALLTHCLDRLKPGGIPVISTPNGRAPHNRRFPIYDPQTMENTDRDTLGSGLGARETHVCNFDMPSLVALIRQRGLAVVEARYLESYFINPIGFHRILPLSVARAIDRIWTTIPFLRERCTLRLVVVARRTRVTTSSA